MSHTSDNKHKSLRDLKLTKLLRFITDVHVCTLELEVKWIRWLKFIKTIK